MDEGWQKWMIDRIERTESTASKNKISVTAAAWKHARGIASARIFNEIWAQRMQISEALLWALAVEIDDRQATRTGYRVCRACGGRGEVVVAWYPAGAYPGCGRWAAPHIDQFHVARRVRSVFDSQPLPTPLRIEICGDDRLSDPAIVTEPCPCDGPTRPDTADLARMVRLLATLGDAPYGDLPDLWQVHLDAMLAAGLGDVVLPGQTRTTPAWMCRWWSAFNEWCVAVGSRMTNWSCSQIRTRPRSTATTRCILRVRVARKSPPQTSEW